MDCLIIDDEEMSRNMVKHFVEKTESLNLIGVCEDAIQAANILKKTKVDILFLDIEMPDMSGYDLLKTLQDPPEIIMVTAKKEHAAEAFDYNVTDYLVKPVNYSRFFQAVGRAIDNILNSKERIRPNEIYVRTDQKIVKISMEELLYVEALADYIMLFTSDNNKYIVHSTMKGFQSKLPSDKFVRVHRSYIVNIDKISSIENLFAVINGKYIPIGASYKDDFMSRLNML
ncbi:MAG: LytTR family DNA-binding domain-containing protein [Cytophagaceae bacterium]|nr:LytTR family DNA-binding domain-containing protein [Cytophagaceae bacterium]